MDGLYNAQGAQEALTQAALTRHRLLLVNTGAVDPVLGSAFASGYAGSDPNTLTGTIASGGPHFIMSPEAPSGQPTLGFEFMIYLGFGFGFPLPAIPNGPNGSMTVTIWELIGSLTDTFGAFSMVWASMAPIVGLNRGELWHSFDVDASAIRFQFTQIGSDGNIMIAFSEL